MKDRRHPETGERPLWVIILILLSILLGIAALFWAGREIERMNEKEEPHGDLTERFTAAPAVMYEGEAYRPKTGVTNLLIIGVDRDADSGTGGGYRNGGQADYLMLLVMDDHAKSITPIQIERDTMAEITVLGVLGNVTGTRTTQICLSHGFGDGAEQSCELTKDAVSRFLLGVEIQYYLAMDMEGISTLNDALGGITVTLEDDFSALDPTMTKGTTLTLKGMQAEYYVRSRKNIGVGTNEARMVRQQVYWNGMSRNFQQRMDVENDAEFVGTLYDLVEPYLTTNMKRGRLINMVWNTRNDEHSAPIHPAGAYAAGKDGFTEFHADETALEQLVMTVFYDKAS